MCSICIPQWISAEKSINQDGTSLFLSQYNTYEYEFPETSSGTGLGIIESLDKRILIIFGKVSLKNCSDSSLLRVSDINLCRVKKHQSS